MNLCGLHGLLKGLLGLQIWSWWEHRDRNVSMMMGEDFNKDVLIIQIM